MCYHAILVLLLIISTSLQSAQKSSCWRFHRLLKAYDNPIYRAEDKDLFLQTDYSSSRKDVLQNDYYRFGNSYLDQQYHLTFNGSTGFKGQWIRSKPDFQSNQSLYLI